MPELARVTIQQGYGVKVGEGKTFWTSVHVHDLSQAYLMLVEAAANGGKPATWGEHGYYFTENGDIVWGEVAEWVAEAAHKQGLIPENLVKSVSKARAAELASFGHALWGANSRARAVRARELLGWEPKAPSLKDEVPNTVAFEAKKLGTKPGHAKVAAGEA